MSLQKFRADELYETSANGAQMWVARWMGGPTFSKVVNCPTPFGPRTVYVTGEADTYFTLPAACRYKGKKVEGFLTCKDHCWEFHAYTQNYWFPHVSEEPEVN